MSSNFLLKWAAFTTLFGYALTQNFDSKYNKTRVIYCKSLLCNKAKKRNEKKRILRQHLNPDLNEAEREFPNQ